MLTPEVARATHDLRTPLHAILASAQLLLDGIPEPLADGSRLHVARISRAAYYLAELVDTLLAFARLEAGADEVRVEEFELRDLVERVNAVAAPLCDAKGLEYVPAVAAPVRLRGDVRKLGQVLINLVGNAIRYTERGQVTFSILHLELGTWFQVADTGMGMTEDEIARISDPFWRSERARPGGTGLGMSVVQRYVEMMDGVLEIASRVDEGTVVRLFVPSSREEA
jgi:signal transduction histidine kinase